MNKTEKSISYTDAMREIEEILSSLQNGETDIDTLAEKVRRATELIGKCREKLCGAKAEVTKILEPAEEK